MTRDPCAHWIGWEDADALDRPRLRAVRWRAAPYTEDRPGGTATVHPGDVGRFLGFETGPSHPAPWQEGVIVSFLDASGHGVGGFVADCADVEPLDPPPAWIAEGE